VSVFGRFDILRTTSPARIWGIASLLLAGTANWSGWKVIEISKSSFRIALALSMRLGSPANRLKPLPPPGSKNFLGTVFLLGSTSIASAPCHGQSAQIRVMGNKHLIAAL